MHCFIKAQILLNMVKSLPAMQETWVQSLGWEDPLEEAMATYKIFDKQKCYWQADCSLGDAQLCICTIKVEAWWSPCLYSGGTARTRVDIIASGTQSQIRHLCDFLMAGEVYLPTVSISRCIQAGCQSQGPENL